MRNEKAVDQKSCEQLLIIGDFHVKNGVGVGMGVGAGVAQLVVC